MPDSGITDAVTVFTSSFYDTYIRQQVIVTCTSGTRPTGVEGRVIYETDTDRIYLYTGSAWAWVGGHSAWQSYSPTLTNVTEGNGTKIGSYARLDNRLVAWNMQFTLGTTSAITGLIGISTPVTAARVDQHPLTADFTDLSAAAILAFPRWGSTSRIDLYAVDSSVTYAQRAVTSSIVPFTWTTGDDFRCGGLFEAASA